MEGLTYLMLGLIGLNLGLIGSLFICFIGILFITYMILIKNKVVEN